ncbi:MAG: M28 family peptidase [Bacteroidetes bacterium]|nr:M28 family peptidase [Bacteroidota bacterium]
MDRSPLSEDGQNLLFEEPAWKTTSLQLKLTTLFYSKAKAILIVSDPKSGLTSVSEQYQELTNENSSKFSLPGDKKDTYRMFLAALPKIIFINRTMADELLKSSGNNLQNLQNEIDKSMKSNSFEIPDKKIRINMVTRNEEKILNNIAGYVEGSDPVLKNEVVVFSGHYDHIGGTGSKVNPGADDDASGCAALLEMAQAFGSLKRNPPELYCFCGYQEKR